MRKIYLLLVCAFLFSNGNTYAQCTSVTPTGRYLNYVFPTYTKTTLSYSSVISADTMDVYQPTGDVSTSRPLVILAHGGSFITGNGDRTNDPTIDTLCVRLARRGYVAVSIDYRTTTAFNMFVAASAADEVAKAISDGKACIRYFSQHASTYGIDTNNIFIGGNSAGAVLFMHVGYIVSVADCSPLIITALNNNGGFDGNSGNPGYTTKCKGVINLAGALNTTGLIHTNGIPSVNCQGDNDATVPYNCGLPLSGGCPDTLCGLGALEPVYNAKSVYHWSKVFAGQAHVPWGSANATGPMMTTVDSFVTQFLYALVCTNVASVNQVNTNTEVNLFPNPATELLNVSAAQPVSGVTMYDQMGRTVLQVDGINKTNSEINTSRLSKGVYFIRIRFNDENNAPVVRKVAIQ